MLIPYLLCYQYYCYCYDYGSFMSIMSMGDFPESLSQQTLGILLRRESGPGLLAVGSNSNNHDMYCLSGKYV